MNKRLRITLIIFLITLSITFFTGCKSKYVMSDDAYLINGGTQNKYSFYYNEELYYEIPFNSCLIMAKDETVKVTVYKKIFAPRHDGKHILEGLSVNRTYLLKKGKVYMIYLYNANFFNDETGQKETEIGEVLKIESGSVYIEHYSK